ncbi:endolytic transglycosylase MltG [Flagellimonas allohymeniacidonis]|uniref:Endolytic murein transglycosylase n=1 Tax=Flagellimonas allohymeniacidonis TaxID=2517819 RepID=A0A4Q8QKP5_9FLAO|nr:endolytic transglycosylase MltG [Allomuricauda hymeniacidonis]TAI49089.1 endolytic transglycosylase MltG [Allomuricauda hymeniacidonis]
MYLKKVLWAAALLGLGICGFIFYQIYAAIFNPNTKFNNEEAFVYINSDATFAEVKEQLQPLLRSVSTFESVAERKGYVTHIKGGKYAIKKGMNNNEIINTLRSANTPVRVSFNNQESLPALAGRISEQIEADSLELVQAFNESSFLNGNGFDQDTKLGMYLPNTYEFFWNTSAHSFRDRMFKEYQRFWNEERIQKAKDLNLTQNEVIALAAIVQKETVKIDERPRVAGVYINRLKRRILLQADPTVIYAIKKETGNYDTIIKRVLYRDLEMDSPYNTYKYAGIPPGPITMPDISSIEAVLNPEKHDYLFFVADVSNFGYHRFAETLAQHNRNKVQYIQWLNSQNLRR